MPGGGAIGITGNNYFGSTSERGSYDYDNLPPELANEAQAINRKQQIANLLIQQGLQEPQGQMAGQFYVAPSPVQGLANLAKILAGSYMGSKYDEARGRIGMDNQTMLQKALFNYQKQAGPQPLAPQGPGAPMQVMTPGQGFSPQELAQPTALYGTKQESLNELAKTNPNLFVQEGQRPQWEPGMGTRPATEEEQRKAIVTSLLGSTHPQAQKIGGAMLGTLESRMDKEAQRDFLAALTGAKATQALQLKQTVSGDVGVTRAGAMERTDLGKVEQINKVLDGMDPESPEAKSLMDLRNKLSTHAPTNSTTVNVDQGEPFIKKLQGEVAEKVAKDQTAAEAAQQSLSTIAQVKNAIATGKVVSGPGATPQIFMRQIGEVLKVGGKNNEEVLTNTRRAIQGMAKLQIDSSKLAQGQGAISDYERRLFEKASAGNDLTNVEIMDLMGAMEKTSNFTIAHHQRNVANVKKLPKGGEVLAPFMELGPMSSPPPAAQAATASSGLSSDEQNELQMLKKKYGR